MSTPRLSSPLTVSRRPYMPLLHRVAGLNVLLVLVAVGVTILVLAPGKVTSFAVDEEVAVVAAAIVLVVAANVYMLRRLVTPVQALTALAKDVDLTNPGQRLPAAEPEVGGGGTRADVQRDARAP